MDKVVVMPSQDLCDIPIKEMQEGLVEQLKWLDHAFGRAERLVKYDGFKRRVYTPNVYTGRNEYMQLLPDSTLGNFCFFDIEDPQNVSYINKAISKMEITMSIIFWFDYRRVLNEDIRNREAVKRQIMDAIVGVLMRTGRFELERVYEQAENIYQGYDIDEVDNQFLMQPYGGLRFEGTLTFKAKCI